jgi:hypothetical protein
LKLPTRWPSQIYIHMLLLDNNKSVGQLGGCTSLHAPVTVQFSCFDISILGEQYTNQGFQNLANPVIK